MGKYWIFKVKKDSNEKYTRTGIEIFRHRMPENFWGLKERTDGNITRYVTDLRKGDCVLFYWVGEYCFLGTRVLKSSFRSDLSPEELKPITHPEYLDWATGVFLEEGTLKDWSSRRLPIDRVKGKVTFAPNIKNWGQHIRGSITQITETDYRTVICEYERMNR